MKIFLEIEKVSNKNKEHGFYEFKIPLLLFTY